MTLRLVRTTLLAALAIALVALPASAQLQDNLGALSGDNAKGYLSPLPKALSGTLNASIFQTGHVAKEGFFLNFGVRLMGVTFDDEDREYTPTDPPGFTSTGSGFKAPTVIGDVNSRTQPGQGGTSLYHPAGFDIGEFALAVPQLSIGSVAGTSATIRWISVDLGDSDLGKFELLGLGVQHSLSQYFEVAPFDLSADVMYQTFKIDDTLVDTKAWHVGVTGSKNFGMFQPYGSIGFDTLDMSTEYTESTSGQTISVDFDQETSFRLAAGGRLNLAFTKLYGEVSLAGRPGAAVGLSFGN